MSKKLSSATKDLIDRFYLVGLGLKEIAEELEISHNTVAVYISIRNRGFSSRYKYDTFLVQEAGFDSVKDYRNFLARQRGQNSNNDYIKNSILKRGFKSYNDYQKKLGETRRKTTLNLAVSSLIKKRLEELGYDQVWLASQLNVSKSMISRYVSGYSIPTNPELLFDVLRLPHKKLEDVLSA